MAADLGRLVATLEAKGEQFDLTLSRAIGRLDKLAGQTEAANARMARSSVQLERALSGVSRGFSALVAAVPIALFARFTAQQVKALDALGNLARQTGLTATSLRQLQVGLELNGGSAEQAGEGLLTFSRNLGQVEAGTGRLTGLLKKLDPAFLATLKAAGSTEAALSLIADRIAVARSEQEKLALATAAFGPAGRQFVLLLGEGARGVDALRERLAALGIGNLDEVTKAAQRFDVQMSLLKETVTTQFAKGLFGIGEGLGSISDALSDKAIRKLGELAFGFGELAVAVGGFAISKLEQILHLLGTAGTLINAEVREIEAFAKFFQTFSQSGIGDAFDALNAGLAPVEQLRTELDGLNADIGKTQAALRALARPTGSEGAISGSARASAIDRLTAQLADQQREAARREAELRARAAERPVTGVGHVGGRVTAAAQLPPPGARGLEAEHQNVLNRLQQQQEAFIASMRQLSEGALSDAQKLSIKLAEQIGKIGETPGLGLEAKSRLQTEAIEAATAAITQAETDALEKQATEVQSFLDRFGVDTLSEAQKISVELARELDKIGQNPALSLEQKSDQQRKLIAGTLPGIDKASETEQRKVILELDTAGSDLSEQLKRELEKAQALVEASDLHDEIARVFAGDPGRIAELQAQNQKQLEEHLGKIESNWDETFTKIGDLGTQVFDDFLEGIAQGSETSAEDMVRAFLLGLAKLEAAALAADLKGVLFGEGVKPTSIIGQALGGEDGSEKDASSAKGAAQSISSQLLDALAAGSGKLVDAGHSAGSAISDAGSAILNAGLAAASAILEALAGQAAASAASSALGAFAFVAAAGGVATSRGLASLERIPALAHGGYSTPRIQRLEDIAKRFGPTISLGDGRSASRGEGTRALVGEAGTERLLTFDRVREIALKSGGNADRAAQLAQQIGVRLDHPEIRDLAPGDVVIPDRKLRAFFERLMPRAKAADGGFAPLRNMTAAVDDSVSGDGGFEFNLSIVNESGTQLGVKRQESKRSGRRIDALMVVGEAGAADVRSGGTMSREMQRSFGVRVAPRET